MGGRTAADGVAALDEGEAAVNALMVERAAHVVVASGNKFGRCAFARIAGTAAIDALVTDDSAPSNEVAALWAGGMRVEVV